MQQEATMTQHLPTRAQATRSSECSGAAALLSLATVPPGRTTAIPQDPEDHVRLHGGPEDRVRDAIDADIEVLTSDLQKIQFTASARALDRPAGLRATRTGGYADVELVFDGKTATIHNRDGKAFTRIEAPGSLDDLLQRLRADHLVEVPGADLLLAKSYDQLTEDVLDAKHVGRGVVDGVECEHLAFRIRIPTGSSGSKRRAADPAQVRHHQQDRRSGAAVHAADQGVADGREARARARSCSRRPTARSRLRSTPSGTSTRCHRASLQEDQSDDTERIFTGIPATAAAVCAFSWSGGPSTSRAS